MNEHEPALLTNDYFAEHTKDIEKVLRRAVNHALLIHKRLGNPIAVGKTARLLSFRLKRCDLTEYLNSEE